MIERKRYLDKLIRKKENGLVKVITGIRRCGKSVLLFRLYHNYLNSIGIDDSHIIEVVLDDDENVRYRNPEELGKHIRSMITDKEKMYYVFLDEIQMVAEILNPYLPGSDEKITFVDVVLGLMKIPNVDLYVTGSNSKMLSSDILTEFRGRGDEIRVYPLSFSEFYSAYDGETRNAWRDYYTYGGMPLCLLQRTHEDKSSYLKGLFKKIYLADIIEHNDVRKDETVLEDMLDLIASSVGSLTNPSKIANTFKTVRHLPLSDDTVATYLGYFADSFLIDMAKRYEIKGRVYIGSPLKYYYTDVGLRNARLNFRQQEENHIMENILYNELLVRGFDVDVGAVVYNYKDKDGKSKRKKLEIDFIANRGSQRFYIQSALNVDGDEKKEQEIRPLLSVNDSFRKIVVVKDNIIPWHDEKGILYIGVQEFLLNEEAMNY